MKITIIKIIPILFGALAFSSHAEEIVSNDDGFLVGVGFFSAGNSNCADCDYSGQIVEVGYDFNSIVGIEAKHGSGDNESNFDLTVNYIGLNIGHDFNSEWFRLYGKIGYAKINEEESIHWDGYCDFSGCYDRPYTEKNNYSNSGVTFGVGTRFTFSGEASGMYLKVESIAVSFDNESVSAALMAGLGYRF